MENLIGSLRSANRFGLQLFSHEVQRFGTRNVLISPPNLFLLFALFHAGARGDTKRELTAALQCAVGGDKAVQHAVRAIQSVLASPPDAAVTQTPLMRTAVAVWADMGLPLDPTWRALAHTDYSAEVASLDFDAPSAIPAMNEWVDAHTDGYIKELFSTVDPRTMLCAATTLVFHGLWQYPFKRMYTQPGPFARQNQPPIQVPMMWKTDRFPYWEDDMVQIISLPFLAMPRDTREFKLIVILPRTGMPLRKVAAELAGEQGTTWLRCLDYVHRYRVLPRGTLMLPRFTIEYGAESDLNVTLTELGMERLFDPARADFGALLQTLPSVDAPVFLNRVLHRTMLMVDEEGAIAAAASGVRLETGLPPPIEFVMEVDRPFLCAIWERMSELLLFIGAIMEPAEVAPA